MELKTRIVLRNDTSANWLANESQVLLKGEVGVEYLADGTVKIKFGDGTTSWKDLPYFGGDKTFDSDLIFTEAFGKYVPDDTGTVTVPATGKTANELIIEAFSDDKNPTTVKPSITLSNIGEFKAYEVGAKVTPSYKITFDEGSYTYDETTGVTLTGYSATFNSETLTTQTGDFAELTVTDTTNIRMSATATYGNGAVPSTALGKEYADGQIKAGTTDTKYSGYITGYRNSFYGTYDAKTDSEGVATGSTSASIRTLKASDKALSNGSKFDVTIPVGAMRVVVAYPATLRDITSIQDNNDSMSNIVSSFTKSTVSVEGANGANGIDYKVYTMDFANPYDTANKYTVTI